MPLYWMSFADARKEPGTQFLGVALVAADDMSCALREAWARGINPGGDVQAFELPLAVAEKIPPEYRNRLLSRDEAEALNRIT